MDFTKPPSMNFEFKIYQLFYKKKVCKKHRNRKLSVSRRPKTWKKTLYLQTRNSSGPYVWNFITFCAMMQSNQLFKTNMICWVIICSFLLSTFPTNQLRAINKYRHVLSFARHNCIQQSSAVKCFACYFLSIIGQCELSFISFYNSIIIYNLIRQLLTWILDYIWYKEAISLTCYSSWLKTILLFTSLFANIFLSEVPLAMKLSEIGFYVGESLGGEWG